MAGHQESTPQSKVTVNRAALRDLKLELARERETARRLQQELTAQVELARKALEDGVSARAEREEYRRVLAAAVANEKRAGEELEALRAELEGVQVAYREALRAQGEAQGRTRELEHLLERERSSHERALNQTREQLQASLDARDRELRRLEEEQGIARGRLHELLRRLPPDSDPSLRARISRARLCLGGTLFLLALFLVFFAPLVLVLFAGAEATWPTMAGGMSPWSLLALEVALFAGSIALATWAVRDLGSVERARREASHSEGGQVFLNEPSSGTEGAGEGEAAAQGPAEVGAG